jgi:asparagine synthase (glutamine-hydrolysing)
VGFWLPLLERAAADGVGVLLDGEGGDELFGLPRYLVADRVRTARPVAAWRLVSRRPDLAGEPRAVRWREFRSDALGGALPPALHEWLRRRRAPLPDAARMFRPEFREAVIAAHDPLGWKRLDGPLWWRHHADLLTTVREELGMLEYFHGRTQMTGLAEGHPLLADVDLVEWMLRQPPGVSWSARFDRPLLRSALAGLLPEEVRVRATKSWFTGVLPEALEGDDRPAVRWLLGDNAEVFRYLDPLPVRDALLDRPVAGRPAAASFLWRAIATEVWLRGLRDPSFDLAGERLGASEPVVSFAG